MGKYERMIIIKPDCSTIREDFFEKSVEDVLEAGKKETFSLNMPIVIDPSKGVEWLPVNLHFSEKNLKSESEINPVATLFTRKEVRGDAVMTVAEKEKERGFYYAKLVINGIEKQAMCECRSAENTIYEFIARNLNQVKEIKKKNEKPKKIMHYSR